MKYKMDPMRPYDVQATEYIGDFFAAQMDDSSSFDSSKLKIYSSNPLDKSTEAKALSGKDLSDHMTQSLPVYVVYNDGKEIPTVEPFLQAGSTIYSGSDIIRKVNEFDAKQPKPPVEPKKPEKPERPAEVARPGAFARFLAVFGIKLQSVRNYKRYQNDLLIYNARMNTFEQDTKAYAQYEKALADFPKRQEAHDRKAAKLDPIKHMMINAENEEELASEINHLRQSRGEEPAFKEHTTVQKGEPAYKPEDFKTTIENDNLMIGDAAPQDPRPKPEQEVHHKTAKTAVDPAQSAADKAEAIHLAAESTRINKENERSNHIITDAEFSTLSAEEQNLWAKQKDGSYLDKVWNSMQKAKAAAKDQADINSLLNIHTAIPLDPTLQDSLTNEQLKAHADALSGIWDKRTAQRAEDCNTIVNTLVDQIWKETPYPRGLRRAEVDRQIRYSDELNTLLHEVKDAPSQYAKMAREDPEKLYQTFGEKLIAMEEAEVQQPDPVKNHQPPVKSGNPMKL